MPALSRVMRPVGSAESADAAWPSGKAAETALGLRSAYATRFDVQDIADIDFPMRTPLYAYTHAHTYMYTCTEHAYTTHALVTRTPSRATHAYTQTHTRTHARTHARTHHLCCWSALRKNRPLYCAATCCNAAHRVATRRGTAQRCRPRVVVAQRRVGPARRARRVHAAADAEGNRAEPHPALVAHQGMCNAVVVTHPQPRCPCRVVTLGCFFLLPPAVHPTSRLLCVAVCEEFAQAHMRRAVPSTRCE
jgi:hypothetical protein